MPRTNPVDAILEQAAADYGAAATRDACKRHLHKRTQRALGVDQERRQKIPRAWVKAAWHRQEGICAWQNHPVALADATGDHIVALNNGGQHVERNIQMMCRPHNSEKSDRDLFEQSKATGRPIKELI